MASRRLDVFVVQLHRYQAREVVLQSNQAAVLRTAHGERQGKGVIEHRALVAMVKEAAPAEALLELSSERRTTFTYAASEGQQALVRVQEAEGRGLRIQLTTPPSGSQAEAEDLLLDIEPSGATEETGPTEEREAQSASGAEVVAQIAPAETPRLERYLRALVKQGGSDLHLSAGEVPMARVHGVMQPLSNTHGPFDEGDLRNLLMAVASDRARQSFEETQDADFAYAIEGLARFRANYFDSRRGIGAVFRQIPFDILSPEALGLPPAVLDLCWLSKGLVVVTGPTGSGKSTTLASLIDFINRQRQDHIITIEDPVEFVHENKKCLVTQREVGTHTLSFKNALRAALREDPDIVLVGEMRDLETIAIAIETAETGHLVFGTLHTTTAASTVDRIIDQFPPDRQAQIRTMLSESLRGVIAQVLCRRVGGGRVGAYEVLITNNAVSNLIREGKTYQLASVMQTSRGQGMQTLNEHLLRLVKSKQVEPKEAYVKSVDKVGFREMLQREQIQLKLE